MFQRFALGMVKSGKNQNHIRFLHTEAVQVIARFINEQVTSCEMLPAFLTHCFALLS